MIGSDAERTMKYICTAFLICSIVFRGDLAFSKDTCTHAWGKGGYKSHKEVENELGAWLANGKILRFSLCSSGNGHYFQITILEAAGKVRVIRVPAR